MKSSITRLLLGTTLLVMAAVLLLPATSQGDEFNLKTYITVSQPVQVPGAVLQPNVKYVLRRVDGNTDHHVLRVMNAEETQVLSTFFAISDQRLEPAEGTILTFYETAPGYAKPVREWFYPGRTIGYEFVYPKEKMMEITAHLRGARTAEVETAQVETQTLQPQATAEAAQAPAEENAIAQNAEPENPSEQVTPAPEKEPTNEANTAASEGNTNGPSALPRTAGELPLFGLLGLAAFSLRQMFRRV